MSNGTVPTITPGQMKDLASALVQSIPSDMSRLVAEVLICRKGALQKAVRRVLMSDEWLPKPTPAPVPAATPEVVKPTAVEQIVPIVTPTAVFTGICKHCKDEISGNKGCSVCHQILLDQCTVCHKELAHGIVYNHNMHFVGSGGGENGPDRDPDAFGLAPFE